MNYTKFYESSENVFPTMSLCIDEPFNATRLAEYGSNQTTYSAFLAGELFSIELMNINYTYVSTDIADFIKGYEVHFKNRKTPKCEFCDKTFKTRSVLSFHVDTYHN